MKRKRPLTNGFILLLVLMILFSSACSKEGYQPTPGEALPETPFYAQPDADGGDVSALVLPFNAVFKYFGGSDEENSRVYRFGNEPTYYEWMALKLAWTRDDAFLRELQDKIVSCPQTDNGYLWSWGTSTYWPTGKGDLHYDGLFRCVSAVAEILVWTGDLSFLDEVDGTTFGESTALDASRGRTVYEKCVLAMEYAERLLHGDTGVITLTEESAYLADGKTRFDKNEAGDCVWNNTGRAGSAPSNYWDNLCFGHKDAYETVLYYHALKNMADVERMRQNAAGVQKYEALAKTVHAAFDKTFWSEETGRYIACVDADGKRWDPGLTFLNTEALCCGLGDAEKAKRIFSWIDGERIVPGDTLTGKEILSYTGVVNRAYGWKTLREAYAFAPVSNTVSIEDLSGDGTPWWFSLEGAIKVGEGGNAAYGKHLENGGYIFFPVYYELTARAKYLGTESVAGRVRQLEAVYRLNGFDSDVGTWVEGLTGEFPESGIVSRVFVSSLAGVTADAEGLRVAPRLPDGVEAFGVKELRYRGVDAELEVRKGGLTLTAASALSGKLRYFPEKEGTYTVSLTYADGAEKTDARSVSGGMALEIALRDVVAVRIF